MQQLKHSRIVVLLSVSFACVALNLWLIATAHYRLPVFVFGGAVLVIAFAFRKLPATATIPEKVNSDLMRASGSARRLGFMFIIAIAISILGLSSGRFRNFPTWGVVLMFAWGGFLIWSAFRGAKWYKDRADAANRGSEKRTKSF